MNLTVIGVQHKKGIYQGVPYDNYFLHCTKPSDGKVSLGLITEFLKIKASEVSSVFDKCMGSVDWQNLIGNKIKYFCDKYGNVIDVRVVEPAKAG